MLAGSLNAKEFFGSGEYAYGPETSESFACLVAEEKAKEEILIKANGEYLSYQIEEFCRDEKCKIEAQTFRKLEGYINEVVNKDVNIYKQLGQTICKVDMYANVKMSKTNLVLTVLGDSSFNENDTFKYTAVANKGGGDLYLFNLFEGKYSRVVYIKNLEERKQITIGPFKAVLPEHSYQSKEKLLFLYVYNNYELSDNYTVAEMNNLLHSLKPDMMDVVRKYVTIRRVK